MASPLTQFMSGEGISLQVRTLVLIRWVAVAGQLISLLTVKYALGFEVDLQITIPLVALMGLVNLIVITRYGLDARLSEREARMQLMFDLLHLASILFVTGGLANPFTVLMLAPTCVSAFLLRQRSTLLLIIIAFVAVTALAFTPFPLPWDGPPPEINPIYLAGHWVGLSFTLVFLTLYMAKVGFDARRRAEALAATKTILEREQQLAEIGSLAAAAAHELATPLGTIMLSASELKDVWLSQKDGAACDSEAVKADLELIIQETSRCREILAELSTTRKTQDHFEVQSFEAVVRQALPVSEHKGIQIYIDAHGEGSEPIMRRQTELMHAIRNLIENAVSFAESQVDVTLEWTEEQFSLTVEDDGPGFDPAILKKLGEPYVTTRKPTPGKDGGMGLGVFIAKTLLERSGATLIFGKAGAESELRGAQVYVQWPRAPRDDN